MNYRLVSLTSTVGKILESIIANKIREHLDKHKLLNFHNMHFSRDFLASQIYCHSTQRYTKQLIVVNNTILFI